MSHTSVSGDARAPGRRARSLWPAGALLVLCLCPAVDAQTRESRLDRVFTGLAYRPLGAEETVAGGVRGGAAPEMLPDPVSATSPHDGQVRYRVDERVHRSEDAGASWSTISPDFGVESARAIGGSDSLTGGTRGPDRSPSGPPLTAVAESPLEPGLIWVAAADGRVHLTRDGGASWTSLDGPLAGRARVLAVEPSAHRGGRAYLVADGTDLDGVGPGAGHTGEQSGATEGAGGSGEARGASQEPGPLVYRVDDYGAEWTILSGEFSGLPPDEAVTVVREDPVREGLLFAATSVGVFVTFDDGGSWDLFQFGLPEVPVTGLTVLGRDLVVSLAGGALWVMDELGPIRQVMDGLTTGEPYLFEPSPVYLDRLPADEGVSDGRGAIFDYLLPSIVRTVRLEVLDAEGRLLATFSGERGSGPGGGSPGQTPETGFRRVPGTRSGVHRIVWDLTASTDGGGEARRVAPGSYLLRMNVDGFVRERTFEVVPEGG